MYVPFVLSAHGLAHMFRGKLRPSNVLPVKGHVSGVLVQILKLLGLYPELDLTACPMTVFDTRKRYIEVSENQDRFGRSGYVLLAKTPDHHLGVPVRINTRDSYSGNVGEVGHLFLGDCCRKLIAVGRWL